MLRARGSGVLALVLRQSGQEEASAAATRWRVRTELSGADDIYQHGVGAMRLSPDARTQPRRTHRPMAFF